MKLQTTVLGAGLILGFASCSDLGPKRAHVGDGSKPTAASADHDDDEDDDEDETEDETEDEDDEQEISLADVPAAAKAAALAAVPGLVLSEAAKETEGGVTLYVLEGKANGVEYEIEVSADGTVHEVEQEHGDDDDDEGDDD